MGDQFDEWDRFWEAYERTRTPARAFRRYRKQRQQVERRAATEKMMRTIATKKALSSSSPESEAVEPSSLMMQWLIVEPSSEDGR